MTIQRRHPLLKTGIQPAAHTHVEADITDLDHTVHTHLEADVTDLQAYILDVTGDNLSALADVTISAIASGEILKWDGAAWINNTLAEAGITAASHTHLEADVTDLQAYILDVTGDNLSALADVTISAIASGELLKWNGSAWINNTLAEAGVAATAHTHLEADVTDLRAYLLNVLEDTTPQLGGNLDLNSKTINGTGTIGITGAITATSYGGIAEGDLVSKASSEVITGEWTFNEPLICQPSSVTTGFEALRLDEQVDNNVSIRFGHVGVQDMWFGMDSNFELIWSTGTDLDTTGNMIWHEGNDGDGSGLDADTIGTIANSNLMTFAGAQVPDMDDIGDVTIVSPTAGDLLEWSGSAWLNKTIDQLDLPERASGETISGLWNFSGSAPTIGGTAISLVGHTHAGGGRTVTTDCANTSVDNTVTETTVFSHTFGAGDLTADDVAFFKIGGVVLNNMGSTQTLKWKVTLDDGTEATAYEDIISMVDGGAGGTRRPWWFNMAIAVRAQTNSMLLQGTWGLAGPTNFPTVGKGGMNRHGEEGADFYPVQNIGDVLRTDIDFSSAVTLKLKITWGTADTNLQFDKDWHYVDSP